MKNKSIDRDIFRLAWPNIISNVSVPLLSSVDTALMGYLSMEHLGAVGLGAMIFNFFYWNFGFLRMGTTGMTAQAYGSRDQQGISTVFYRALLVSTAIAIVIVGFQGFIVNVGVDWMNAPSGQISLVSTYVLTRIWAAPATLGLYVLMGWLFGMQNARVPMYVTIAINIVNIVLSYFLIVNLGMGIQGAAIGTVIAQYFGLVVILIMIANSYTSELRFPTVSELFQWDAFKHFFLINRDIFIRTLCLTFAFGFFYSKSAIYGEVMLGVNVVLLQFLNWMSYGIDGFAFAAESLVGKHYGARTYDTLNATIRRIFFWSIIMAFGYALLYGLGGKWLFRVFTDVEEVLAASGPFILWMAVLPLLGFASYIWDGIFVGLTASKAMRNSMVISLIGYLGSYYLLEQILGMHALWVALSVFLLLRGFIQHLMYAQKGYQLT